MNLAQIIDHSDFLSKLYPTDKVDLVSTSEKILIKEDQTIYLQDAVGEFIYFLASGEVEVFTESNSQIKLPGESFGEEVYFGTHRYLANAVAKKDCEIYMIPKDSFKSIKSESQKFSDVFFTSFCRLITKKIPDLSFASHTRLTDIVHYTEIIGWFCTLVLPLIILKASEMTTIPPESRYFLSLLTCSVSMWMFRLLPEFLPGIFLLMSTLMFNLAPTNVVLSGLSSETFLLIMSVFVISLLITSSGLTHRLSIYLMNYASNSILGLNLAIFFIGMLLTPMVPSIISRCVLLTPLVSKMVHNFKISNKSFLSVQFAASTFFGYSIFANVILSSSLMNFVVLGLLPTQEQDQFQWFGWLKAASIYGLVVAIGYFAFMMITMLLNEKNSLPKSNFKEQSQALGKLRREEVIGIIGIALVTIGLLTNSYHRIHPAIVTLFIMFCIFGFGFISKNQFQKEIDWPFLIFMASAVSITATIKHLGLDIWIAELLETITSYSTSGILFLTLISAITLITRLFLPIAPTVVLLCTAFIPLATNEGVNPWLVAFTILVAADIWFIPYQNSFYLIFEELGLINNELFYDRSKLIFYNLFIGIIKIGALFVSIPYWKSMGLI